MNLSSKQHNTNSNTATLDDLENIIDSAIKRIGGANENDLCKFLPGSEGGYMHHFTLRKMASQEPGKLSTMIHEFIIDNKNPEKLPPKVRAARGSRKRRDIITLSRSELEDVLNFARQTGRNDIAAKLSPKKSLSACKKELIASIKRERIEQELWRSYVDAISISSNPEASHNAGKEMTINTTL